jgi:hypothetical protein
MLAIQRCIGFILLLAISICFAGCGSSGGASMDQMAGAADAQKAAKQQQDEAAAAKAATDQKAATAAPATPAQTSTEPSKKVGGRQTQGLGGGYYAAIIGARRHVMNVVDSIAWIQGVRSFKAEEGRKPKDNAEFMKVVVTKYELQLPKIEADEEYLYDPNGESDGDFGQLYVVKKGTEPASGTAPNSSPPSAPAPAAK